MDERLEEHKFSSLGRLLAGIVHEINTPIGSILSNNEVIIRSLAILAKDLDENSEKSLRHARTVLETCSSLAQVDKIACERISGLVRGLKGFARAPSTEIRRIDLGEQIINTLKLVKGEYGRRVKFVTEIGDLPPVEANPGKLNQVVLNLVVNAAQAIECDGTVTVSAVREENMVHIAVRDTGKGIPPDVVSRMFQSGFTTKPAGEGTGLGLTISRQIVEELHGGSLTFDTAAGEGTTFHIRIPITHGERIGQ